MKKYFVLIFLILACGLVIFLQLQKYKPLSVENLKGSKKDPMDTTPYEWVKENELIAHGMGDINGMRVTNSLDAFLQSYEEGIRVFEVDLIFTTDDVLVARHDWGEGLFDLLNQETDKKETLSSEEFKELRINNEYVPMTWDDIALLMKKYPDVLIVTDTKSGEEQDVRKAFEYIVEKTKMVDESALDRIVPQIYNEPMLSILHEYHPFKNVIYTLYMTNDSDEEVVNFALKNNINIITLSETRMTNEFIQRLNEQNIYSFVHTINDIDVMKKYLDIGVTGFYTDFITPEEIDAIKNGKED